MSSRILFAGLLVLSVLVALSVLAILMLTRCGLLPDSVTVNRSYDVIGPREDPGASQLVDAIRLGASEETLQAILDSHPEAIGGHVQAMGTPLHSCILLSRPEHIQWLLSRGASPTKKCDKEWMFIYDQSPFLSCNLSRLSSLDLAAAELDLGCFWQILDWAIEHERVSPEDAGRIECILQAAGHDEALPEFRKTLVSHSEKP